MKTLRFWGHSDDCFEIDGAIQDEIGASGRGVNLRLTSPLTNDRLRIHGIYAPGNGATWVFGVGLVEEDDRLPPWPIRFVPEHAYSLALEIDVPDDIVVEHEVDRKLVPIT